MGVQTLDRRRVGFADFVQISDGSNGLPTATGETPLLWIMFSTSLAAMVSILLVMRREARLAASL